MANIRYVANYTATVNANPKAIWATWSDPRKWTSLDDGNKAVAEDKGAFRAGTIVRLTLRTGQTVDVKLTEVSEGKAFSDETTLPYGVVRTHHKMEPSGRNLIVSYLIEADIADESAAAFEKEYWPNLLEGIPHQVHNVVAIAKAG
jgi:Polyketide cyclase / dehydrase and lipid transport